MYYTTMYPEDSSSLQANGNMSSTSISSGINAEVALKFNFYGEAVAQPAILLVGLVTNIMSLVVLRKVKMTETFKICLMALAISDLCACVMGSVQQLVQGVYFQGGSPYGYHSPAAVANFTLYFAFLLFMSVSGCLVVMIAVVRNLIVLKPLKARHWFTRSKTIRIALGVFLANLVGYLPSFFGVAWMTCYKDVAPFCQSVNETIGFTIVESIFNAHIYFISITYGPIIILIYVACVISIWVTLKRSTKELATMATTRMDKGEDNATQRDKTMSKINRTLVTICFLEMACTLPSVIYGITIATKPKDEVFEVQLEPEIEVFHVVSEIFYCFRPAYNFWVYFFNNPDFRRGIRNMCSNLNICGWRKYSLDINSVPRSSSNKSTMDTISEVKQVAEQSTSLC